ncbi:DUF6625 family protein [Leuconostoc lactis]
MSNKLLIMPYYGKFPNYFQLWLESIKKNPELELLLVTDANLDNYNMDAPNIHIMTKSIDQLKQMIEMVTGSKINLNKGYKIKDYFPLYGEIFSEYITDGSYDWWGSIDADVILGNVNSFLRDEDLSSVDRIFGNGHFSLYRNTKKMNRLWRNPKLNSYFDIVPFIYTQRFNKNTAFDEYGWNWGKGISTFMEREGYRINNDFPRADLDFNFSGFKSQYININSKNIDENTADFIEVTNDGIFVTDKLGIQHEVMYVHLQKRQMQIDSELDSESKAFDIYPNIFVPRKKIVPKDEIDKMSADFEKQRQQRISKTKIHNLLSDYIVLRTLMMFRKFKSRF